MKKKDRNIIFSHSKKILLVLGLAVCFLSPVVIFAQGAGVGDKYGLSQTANKTELAGLAISKTTPEGLAATIVQNLLLFVGIIFFLILLYAGIYWMTARGVTEKVNKAKAILETAIIGLIIVTASYAVSTFIFSRLATTAGGSSTGKAWCQYVVSNEPVCKEIKDTAEEINACVSGSGGTVVYTDCTQQ